MRPDDPRTDTNREMEQALERMDARGEAIRAEQLDRALEQLAATGSVSGAQREAVEQLSRRLVERLLAVPQSSLRASVQRGDEGAAETAVELFG